jgi:integrase
MRGKGEGSVYLRSDGLWCAAVELPPLNGKRRKKIVTSKSKAEVLRKMSRVKAELERAGDLPTASQTLESWLTYWLDKVAAKRVRPNVLATYRSLVKRRIIPTLGNVRLDKLTPAHVLRLHDAMIADGLSSTYALNAYRLLSKSFEDAMREGRMSRNPAKLTDAPRKAVTKLETLTLDEAIEVVARAVPALLTTPYDATPVRMAAYLLTAFRRGEMLGLEVDRIGVDSIDLSWQLQRISKRDIQVMRADNEVRHLRGGLYLTRPKSRAGWRVIPLVEPLRSLLRDHLARMEPNEYGLVFATPDGHPLDPRREWDRWHETLEALGIDRETRNIRLHDARHTAVDILYEAGVSEELIVEIVGHSTRSMTRAYKSRGNQKRLTEAMTQFSALLSRQPHE